MTDRSKKSTYSGVSINSHPELSSEFRLWRAVVSQAISDVYLDNPRHKLEVLEWLETDDFEVVCDLADLNADFVAKSIRNIAESKPAIARFYGRKVKDVIDK